MERSRTLIQQSSLRLSQRFIQRFFATTLAFALVALVACDSGTPEPDAPAPAKPEYGAMNTDSGATKSEAPRAAIPGDGSIAAERFPSSLPEGLSAEVPENFPRSIPIYPGAQPAQGKGAVRPDGTGIGGVQLVSNDEPNEIYAFYEKELKANGWDITRSRNDGTVAAITIENGSEQVEMLFMASPLGGTDILSVYERKN